MIKEEQPIKRMDRTVNHQWWWKFNYKELSLRIKKSVSGNENSESMKAPGDFGKNIVLMLDKKLN